jgi:hypothetical protein
MNAKFAGAKPIPTSNPFGNAKLRTPTERSDDLLGALLARVREAARRIRTGKSAS